MYIRLLKYIKELRGEVLKKTLLSLCLTFTYIIQAIAMARIVNMLFEGSRLSAMTGEFIVVIAAISLRAVAVKINETFTKTMAEKIKGSLRYSVLSHIFRLGPGQMTEKRSGEVTSLMVDGIESLEPFFVNFLPQVITVITTGIFAFIYLGRYDIKGAILLIAAMVLCVLIPFLTVPIVEKNINNYWEDYSRLTSQYIDAVQGITTLKTLDAEESMGETLEKDATAFWHRSIRNTGISLSNSAVILVLTAVTSSLSVVYVALRAHMGIVPVSAVTLFLFLTVECARPLFDLNRYWHSSFLGISTARGLFAILDTEPKVKEAGNPVNEGLEGKPEIEFSHVDFSYTGTEDVLHDVSFTIPAGSRTAIVGRSGSGKSTLINLMLRFYEPGSGAIKYNGKDIREYGIDYLESKISAVFQDSFLFYGNIMDNIRMAKPDASDEEVINAAKMANVDEFVSALSDGYDTIVGERGFTLSGGERQRVSIARAILKDSPILLLDEATASVDAENEQKIQHSLDMLSRDRTSVIVAHRLSTVQNADKIIVMDKGRVVEEGTHDELLKKGGIYHSLVKAQEEVKNG